MVRKKVVLNLTNTVDSKWNIAVQVDFDIVKNVPRSEFLNLLDDELNCVRQMFIDKYDEFNTK